MEQIVEHSSKRSAVLTGAYRSTGFRLLSVMVFEKTVGPWIPYLDGKIDMATAIRRIIAEYGIDPPTKSRS